MAWMSLLCRVTLAVLPDCSHGKPVPTPVVRTLGADGLERVGVDFAARPVNTVTVTRAPMFVVALKQAGDTQKLVIPAKGQALALARMGKAPCSVSIAHLKTTGKTAQVHFQAVSHEGTRRVFAATATVPFGVEKCVALACDTCPEPMPLKVKLEPMKDSTATMVLPPKAAPATACPVPCCPPGCCVEPGSCFGPAPVPCLPTVGFMSCTLPAPPLPFPAWPAPPVSSVAMPAPMPVGPMMPPSMALPMPSVVPCVAVAPLRATKTMRLVKEDGKARVEMRSSDLTSKAVRMTLEEGMAGTMEVAAGAKHVHLSGKGWKAQADKVEVDGHGMVTLHGHCKLTCEKLGSGASLTGDKLRFHVQGGRFVELAR